MALVGVPSRCLGPPSVGPMAANWSFTVNFSPQGSRDSLMDFVRYSRMSGRAVIRAVHNPLPGARPKPARPPIVPSSRIAALLEKPTWSVKSLLPNADSQPTPTVTPKQLQHLLRLSALPQPKDEQEEAEMLKTLESQIHFVREMQKVDTTGVEPLRAIRDETTEGIKEQTIMLADLQEYLDAEEVVGRNGRVKRRPKEDPEAREAEDWDPFAISEGQGKNKGRYFFVRKEKKVQDKQV
jgi:Asp-tRNA(Asn)/Glu-tRNA(Gln) amidotransferase C subunit